MSAPKQGKFFRRRSSRHPIWEGVRFDVSARDVKLAFAQTDEKDLLGFFFDRRSKKEEARIRDQFERWRSAAGGETEP